MKQGSVEWKKMRRRALNDLYFFCTAILGLADKFSLEEETHRLLLLFAERRTGVPEIDKAPFQLILWPRTVGKSACVTVGRSMQMALRDPDTSIMIANEKLELASEFIGVIKQHFEQNELLRALFPEVIPVDFNKVDWSQTRATLNRTTASPQPTFFAIGVGGALAGKHPQHVVCDDLISDDAMENARSGNWNIMQRVNRWINHLPPVLAERAKPFPTLTFIGTRWFHDDSYEHIRDSFGRGEDPKRYRIPIRLSNGRTVSRTATVVGPLAIMEVAVIEEGQLIFPNIWPQDEIDAVMRNDPEFGACSLFNNPSNSAIRTFQEEWLRYWRYVDEGRTIVYDDENKQKQFVTVRSLYKTIAVDPAASSGAVEGARNAIVVLGTDQASGKHFVLDVVAHRSDPRDLITDVVDVAQRWDAKVVHIELAGQQAYIIQWVERESRQREYPLAVEPLKPGGRNKDLRIGGLVVPLKNGDIYVHSSQTVLLQDEYRHYRPGAKKRDVLDALAYAMEVAPHPISGHATSAKERSRLQLAAYHNRIGVAV